MVVRNIVGPAVETARYPNQLLGVYYVLNSFPVDTSVSKLVRPKERLFFEEFDNQLLLSHAATNSIHLLINVNILWRETIHSYNTVTGHCER